MAYSVPFPKQAPWFIYGPYLAPDGLWRCGFVVSNGQLHLETEEAFVTALECEEFFKQNDHGLANANAKE